MPKAIVKRISNIFLSDVVLHESIPIYSDGLRKSGFQDIITFIPKTTNTKTDKSKSRKHKIKWFHLLYCPSVKTNVERIFSRLIKTFKLIVKLNLKLINSASFSKKYSKS